MITVEKLEKGTYFDDAFKISFRYDPTTVAKVKELAERRYLPEDRAWEIPAHELPALIEKVGLSNIKSEEAVVQALNTKEIEDKREATQERLKGIKPVRDFDFKTAPLPHQIEAFNYGMEKNSLLIGDEQGLGKTKESIDICVARKKELIKTLIVCGVNSVKYNWEKEIQIHSNESCVMVDGKTMDVRVQQLNDWYRGSSYFGVINIESLRNEKIQDALYLGIKDGYIGAIIVDEIHKAKNGGSQQGKALRFLKAPVKIGLSGTPMNKAEDLWNILTWLGVERRSFYSFRNAYCTMGGFGGYKVIGYKNLDSLNAELNTVMLRRKKEEVLDLPPKLYSTEYVELTTAQKKQYRDIKNGIVADMENILASVNPLNCTLRLRQLTSGNPNLTDDSPKLDRIKEMLEEEIIPNGHKAIIFSQWSTIAKDLGIELSEYDPIVITGEVPPEQRQRLVDNFQTKIYVVTGNTYEIREELREAGAKYRGGINWYFLEKQGRYPTIELSYEECLNIYPEYGTMSWKDLTEVQAVLNSKIPTEEDPSQYVGQVGDRLDLVVIFKKRSTYDIPSYAGWGTDTVGINVFRDDAGNCFIWKSTSAFFNIAEGSKVRLRGTVKEHSDYKGTKQTILQRCKVDAVKL